MNREVGLDSLTGQGLERRTASSTRAASGGRGISVACRARAIQSSILPGRPLAAPAASRAGPLVTEMSSGECPMSGEERRVAFIVQRDNSQLEKYTNAMIQGAERTRSSATMKGLS
jgi:hypothetical protein